MQGSYFWHHDGQDSDVYENKLQLSNGPVDFMLPGKTTGPIGPMVSFTIRDFFLCNIM